MPRSTGRVGTFNGDIPRLTVGTQTDCPHLAVNSHEAGSYAEAREDRGQPVDAISLGNAVEVDGDRRALSHRRANRIEFELQSLDDKTLTAHEKAVFLVPR